MEQNLVSMCSECKKIRIGDDTWVGRRYKSYYEIINNPDVIISDGYCPEHLDNNQLRKRMVTSK